MRSQIERKWWSQMQMMIYVYYILLAQKCIDASKMICKLSSLTNILPWNRSYLFDSSKFNGRIKLCLTLPCGRYYIYDVECIQSSICLHCCSQSDIKQNASLIFTTPTHHRCQIIIAVHWTFLLFTICVVPFADINLLTEIKILHAPYWNHQLHMQMQMRFVNYSIFPLFSVMWMWSLSINTDNTLCAFVWFANW